MTFVVNSIGALHAVTGDYDAGFYYAGATILVSGIMLFLLPRKQRKTEWIYNQSSMNFLEATLVIRPAVAWQLGVPPLDLKQPMHINQNEVHNTQGQNSDNVTTHL